MRRNFGSVGDRYSGDRVVPAGVRRFGDCVGPRAWPVCQQWWAPGELDKLAPLAAQRQGSEWIDNAAPGVEQGGKTATASVSDDSLRRAIALTRGMEAMIDDALGKMRFRSPRSRARVGACAVEVLLAVDWRASAGEVGSWPEYGHLGGPTLGRKSHTGRPERKRFAFHTWSMGTARRKASALAELAADVRNRSSPVRHQVPRVAKLLWHHDTRLEQPKRKRFLRATLRCRAGRCSNGPFRGGSERWLQMDEHRELEERFGVVGRRRRRHGSFRRAWSAERGFATLHVATGEGAAAVELAQPCASGRARVARFTSASVCHGGG